MESSKQGGCHEEKTKEEKNDKKDEKRHKIYVPGMWTRR